MVPVAEKSSYLQSFADEPLLRFFISWLWEENAELPGNLSHKDANDIAIVCMHSVATNNKKAFTDAYRNISSRSPNQDSDWIYNDLLLFALLCGIKKFLMSTEWIKKVLDTRQHIDEDSRLLKQSYIDIIYDNLQSKNNLYCVIIVASHLLGHNSMNENIMNDTYVMLSKQRFPYHKSHFLNIIVIRAIDLMFLSKGMIDSDKLHKSIEFSEVFEKKVHKVSGYIGLYGISTVIILLSIFLSQWALTLKGKEFDVINKITSLLFPLLGCGGIFGIFKFRSQITTFIEDWLFTFWGYK